MKIGIITIHNVSNYGAVLQTYALQESLQSENVSVIDFDNRHVSYSLDLIRTGTSFHALLGMGKDIARIWPRYRVLNKFNKFIKNNLNILPFESTKLHGLDALISGSDQIWNPACVSQEKKLVPEYLLNFAQEGQTVISYASSCGAYHFNSEELSTLKQHLEKYHALSVRESGTAELLTDLMKKDVSHVIDPTLLLTKEEWLNKLGDNKFRQEDFILVYVIKKTPLLKKVIKQVKDQLNMKVILINQGLFFDSIIDEHIRDAGPHDFISLFNNAKFVVTDSFHGTTFSLIFNKPFYSVSPGKNMNRISSLLNKIQLEQRMIESESDAINPTSVVPYDIANELLNAEREKSKNYLFKALGI
ncbi:polysaccharide pyruvyl transferase family protein [Vibrio breoganii]|uniref:polysaccharide pyruvyl transferase family protein n=1 Tax=Vibrio breoganii TaxID=553239 RepID=UPI000C8366EF|nr:polysaccharide pyruvyl transferase family protein [Vibrio breoganii]PMK30130.1 hypothetical protein BCU03_10340 [Vibrio breoganii]